MKCEEVHKKMLLFLDGELEKEEMDRIRAHIEKCVGCFAREKVEKAFKSLISASSRGIEVPPYLKDRILGEIKKRESKLPDFFKNNYGKLGFVVALLLMSAFLIPRSHGVEKVWNLQGHLVSDIGPSKEETAGREDRRAINRIDRGDGKLWDIIESDKTSDLIYNPSFRGCCIKFSGTLDAKHHTVELTSFVITKETP